MDNMAEGQCMHQSSKFAVLNDREGNSMSCLSTRGILLPPTYNHISDFFDRVDTFNGRPDDVWICGFPKSGHHWLWEIVSMLRAESTELMSKTKEESTLGYKTNEELDSLVSPRTLCSHLPKSLLPRTIWENGNKIVYIMRNPKDTVVATYHYVKGLGYGGSFGAFLGTQCMFGNNMVYGGWYRNVLEAKQELKDNPSVLFVKYEDIKLDPLPSYKRIAEFLGKRSDETFLNEVVRKTSFQYMKSNKTESDGYGNSFMRKGVVGDWINFFTVADNERFNEEYAKKNMAACDLKFDFGF